jgi:Uma2 family endonuclease
MLAQEPLSKRLPDHTQLPESDGTFVKNFLEHPQSMLLTDALEPVLERLHPDGQYCIGQDCGIYWRQTIPPEPPEKGAEAPDWFYVPEVPPLLDGTYRKSYVMWQELIAPLIVIEFVSGDGSEERDQTRGKGKFWVYERVIHPVYYGIYDVKLGRIELYELVRGRYELVSPNEHGHFPIEPLGVTLGIWQAKFIDMTLPWMRWYDNDGSLLPISKELAEYERHRAELAEAQLQQERQRANLAEQETQQERQRAEVAEEQIQQERQKVTLADQRAEQADQRAQQAEELAQQERQRADALAQRLHSLGIDPSAL